MSGATWPDLPGDAAYTEIGRTEYTLFTDGTEALAEWERTEDGEMELRHAEIRRVEPGESLAAAVFGPDILGLAIEATERGKQ